MDEILRMEQITKIYPGGVIANRGVNFSLRKGEIHAVCGENGAGKSTLMKILFGLEQPTSGSLYLNGVQISLRSPLDALRHAIGMVHQHFMLVDNLTVAENLFLGFEPKKNFLIDRREMFQQTELIAAKYQMEIDPHALCANLTVGQKQKVEILKVLLRGAKIIILDEPTAVLTPQETKELFNQLLLLKQDDRTIIIITHKLKEVKQLCDRVTILRQGKSYGVYPVCDMEIEDISRLMVGVDVELNIVKSTSKPGNKLLTVEHLCVDGENGKEKIADVSFDLFAGEILCVAGVEGNGQHELIEAVTGFNPSFTGVVKIVGHNIKGKSIMDIRRFGLAHIPEDRMTMGVDLEKSILDNLISLKIDEKRYSKFGFINYRALRKEAKKELTALRVNYMKDNQTVKMLSGGNMQKIVIARELANNPQILVAEQPTRGVDIGAIEFIHKKLIKLRDQGKAILLVSADLQEVFNLADRIIVLYNGRLTATINDVKSLTEERLGYYMLGVEANR